MKKLLALILALLMGLTVMTGCGKKEAEKPQNEDEVEQEEKETEKEEDEKEDEEETSTFKIGAIGPLTGPAAAYGKAVRQGALIAVAEINANGGINGSLIEFNIHDDEHNPEKSVNAYNYLKDWGMQMLVGPVTSGPCVAVVGMAEQDDMFMITPTASAVDSIGEHGFRMCFSDPAQGKKSAQYIAENNLATKIGVIYDCSDIYSVGIYETFMEEAEKRGLEIVAESAFTPESKFDFSAQVMMMKSAEAELVFLPIYYNEAALILAEAEKYAYAPIFFGCDGLDGILEVEGFDPSLAEGLMILTPFASDAQDSQTVNFVEEYEDRFGETPNQFAADAYDCIYAIKAAIEESGVTVDMSIGDIGDALSDAMTDITIDGLTGDVVTWGRDGETDKEPKAVVIENGEYVLAQ